MRAVGNDRWEIAVSVQRSISDIPQATAGVLLEAAPQGPVQPPRKIGREVVPGWIVCKYRGQHVAHGLASEEPSANQHLEEHNAEGPDVGALVDGLSSRLLGGHVRGGTEDDACLRRLG